MGYKVPVASVRSVPKLSLLGGDSSSEYGDEPEKALLSRKGVTTLRTRGFTPGMLVSVTGLESDAGQQYNDTQARVLGWNPLSEKWNVKLFTGVTAAIPAKIYSPSERAHFVRFWQRPRVFWLCHKYDLRRVRTECIICLFLEMPPTDSHESTACSHVFLLRWQK